MPSTLQHNPTKSQKMLQAKQLKEAGMLQSQIATTLDVCENTISNYLQDIAKQTANLALFKKSLSDALHVDLLLGLSIKYKLLNDLNNGGLGDISKMSMTDKRQLIRDIGVSNGISYDKIRLQDGKSTSNDSHFIQLTQVHKSIKYDAPTRYRKQGSKRGTITVDSTSANSETAHEQWWCSVEREHNRITIMRRWATMNDGWYFYGSLIPYSNCPGAGGEILAKLTCTPSLSADKNKMNIFKHKVNGRFMTTKKATKKKLASKEQLPEKFLPPQWVQDMHEYFREHGFYRAEDLHRVLGDPRESVHIQASTDLHQQATWR